MLQYPANCVNGVSGDMTYIFFAYDGPNHSRYLVWFDVFLISIDESHPGANDLLKKGGIAVADLSFQAHSMQ